MPPVYAERGTNVGWKDWRPSPAIPPVTGAAGCSTEPSAMTDEAYRAIRNVGRHSGHLLLVPGRRLPPANLGDKQRQTNSKVQSIPEHKGSKYVRLAFTHTGARPAGQREDEGFGGWWAAFPDDPSPLLRRHALLALCLVCRAERSRSSARGM